ncbi:MAG TPA: methionine--tRNA ligase [Gaiellaceae bacterium]|nr:methionine--tRNA ligase [Gaiellaceae bacterium]
MSTRRRFYITTAIPYVNGDAHLGHALEFVQADVLARHRRLRGDDVRFLSGTDDNALKNVDAALAAGLPVAEFVAEKAQRLADLAAPLQLSNDDFIRTSTDRRHRPGVERLWAACAAAGDLYQRDYEGLYCSGCEAFVLPGDLHDGRCPEHDEAPEPIVERNWFFRLSRYQNAILDLIEGDRLRIEPEHRRNEVLAFIRGGLGDFSVSRAQERAQGWGIPVPGDPTQVIYVWFDALANYITALDFGHGGASYDDWWRESDERQHVIGKGIIRFHAIYWPAILLSAGQPLPTTISVHDYLTVEGKKLSKSLGTAIDPVEVIDRYGPDALRWWFLRDVPRAGDADFRSDLVAARANELADGLGNLVNRTIALARRNRAGRPRREGRTVVEATSLLGLCAELPSAIDEALAVFDLRRAAAALWQVVSEANRFVSTTQPWELAKAARTGDDGASAELDAVLGVLLDACSCIAYELGPFLPLAAERIDLALADLDPQRGRALFPKVEHA